MNNNTIYHWWWNAWTGLAFYRWGFAFRLFWFRIVVDLGKAYVY